MSGLATAYAAVTQPFSSSHAQTLAAAGATALKMPSAILPLQTQTNLHGFATNTSYRGSHCCKQDPLASAISMLDHNTQQVGTSAVMELQWSITAPVVVVVFTTALVHAWSMTVQWHQ